MKVCVQVPLVNIDTVFITVENQNFKVKALAPLFNTPPVYCVDATTATQVDVYINFSKTMQGGGYSTATAATKFTVISNSKHELFNNFQNITLSKFMKGVTYLIPVGAYAPLPMIPNVGLYPVAGASEILAKIGTAGTPNVLDVLYTPCISATHYRFDCSEDMDILNATSIASVISCEMDGRAVIQREKEKAPAKVAEAVNFARSIGAGA